MNSFFSATLNEKVLKKRRELKGMQ